MYGSEIEILLSYHTLSNFDGLMGLIKEYMYICFP